MYDEFLNTSRQERIVEISSALLLLLAAITAMVLANSTLSEQYYALRDTTVVLALPGFEISQSVFHWINDGLMVLFFLLVSMEVKREIVYGELHSLKRAAFPVAAAIGGMLVPALVYVSFTAGTPDVVGWGVPIATDVVFALGVLMIIGKRVSPSLRVFLLTLAVVDDIGAIAVIGFFYSEDLVVSWIIGAIIIFLALLVLNRLGVRSLIPYIVLGAVLWTFFLTSGVHATVAGVLLGFAIPARLGPRAPKNAALPLDIAEHNLRPVVMFFVLPIFALTNVGIQIDAGFISDIASSPIAWGVALGLILGKQLGIVSFAWLATRLKIACVPIGMGWIHVWGISWLAAIGFTVAMFISDLAFAQDGKLEQAHAGILTASLVAGLGGYILLRFFTRKVPAKAMKGTCK